jgi:carbonic anhydrase
MTMNIPPPLRGDEKYRDLLTSIESGVDIPDQWKGTPIESFIMAQNFGWPIQGTGKAELLISTCIEFRYSLPVPRMYAYVIRRASGRVLGSEFSVGYTIAQGVKYLALIGHNDCGMSKALANAPRVVAALVDQGWDEGMAKQYVEGQVKRHGIADELDALKTEFIRLRKIFRKLLIAPLFVCLHDSKLYVPAWYSEVNAELDRDTSGVPRDLIENLP